jgi:hypothetical protein
MLRVLALLSYLAMVLVPLALAQAQPACAMEAGVAPHVMTVVALEPDDQTTMPTHHSVTEVCKQMCSILAVLPRVNPGASWIGVILPPLRPSAVLLASQPSSPFERPPRMPV